MGRSSLRSEEVGCLKTTNWWIINQPGPTCTPARWEEIIHFISTTKMRGNTQEVQRNIALEALGEQHAWLLFHLRTVIYSSPLIQIWPRSCERGGVVYFQGAYHSHEWKAYTRKWNEGNTQRENSVIGEQKIKHKKGKLMVLTDHWWYLRQLHFLHHQGQKTG